MWSRAFRGSRLNGKSPLIDRIVFTAFSAVNHQTIKNKKIKKKKIYDA